MNLNCIEILFLIFGWIYAIKGLVIASLVMSAFWLVFLIIAEASGGEHTSKTTIVTIELTLCFAMSIICLCIRF